MSRIEFFYDCSSPWTYLAFHSIQPLAVEFGIAIDWRPILVGGLFNTINPSVYLARENPVPAKAAYAQKDLADWARLYGLAIGRPPVFPVNSVKAMRAALVAAPEGRLVPFSRAVFEAYWGRLEDISQDAVLRPLMTAVGLDADKVFARIADSDIKDALKANTEEVAARGGFGSPTIFVNGSDMYFGNDRMPLIRAALERGRQAA